MSAQDSAAVDVMLVLAAVYGAQSGRVLDATSALKLIESTRQQREMIAEYRRLRSQLAETSKNHPIYGEAKNFELQLERWLADRLLPLLPKATEQRPPLAAQIRLLLPDDLPEKTAAGLAATLAGVLTPG